MLTTLAGSIIRFPDSPSIWSIIPDVLAVIAFGVAIYVIAFLRRTVKSLMQLYCVLLDMCIGNRELHVAVSETLKDEILETTGRNAVEAKKLSRKLAEELKITTDRRENGDGNNPVIPGQRPSPPDEN